MNRVQAVTDEDRRAAGYELRPSQDGSHLVFHDLTRRRANRPPEAPIPRTPAEWVGDRLGEIEDQAQKAANWIAALTVERDFLKGEFDRETLNAAKWHKRYREVTDFSIIAVALLAISIVLHIARSI